MFCFIRPLWKVHREMNYWRKSNLERLHEIGHRIHLNESRLLDDAEKIEHQKFGFVYNEQGNMKKFYTLNKNLPEWPFNISILGQLFLTYIIPIAGLLSQLYSLMPSLHP